MKARILFPMLYAVAAATLIFLFGGIGHGWGIEAFYYLSLPAGLLSLPVEAATASGELALLSCFMLGITQYFLLGYALEIIRKAMRKN